MAREEELFEWLETMPETVDGVSGGFLSMKAAREWAEETGGTEHDERKLLTMLRRKQESVMTRDEGGIMAESSTGKSRLTDEEIREYAVELFLGSLPKLEEEKKSENKEIRQHNITRPTSRSVMTSEQSMKIHGEIQATDEERLQLMQEVLGLKPEKAKELLQIFKTRGR